MPRDKPILAVDFDGVLHSYTSGWQGAALVTDPPTRGAMQFLSEAVEHFNVHIVSSRCSQPGGIPAIKQWIKRYLLEYFEVLYLNNGKPKEAVTDAAMAVYNRLRFTTSKPAAMVTLDDRAVCFDGSFPEPSDLLKFRTWMQK